MYCTLSRSDWFQTDRHAEDIRLDVLHRGTAFELALVHHQFLGVRIALQVLAEPGDDPFDLLMREAYGLPVPL